MNTENNANLRTSYGPTKDLQSIEIFRSQLEQELDELLFASCKENPVAGGILHELHSKIKTQKKSVWSFLHCFRSHEQAYHTSCAGCGEKRRDRGAAIDLLLSQFIVGPFLMPYLEKTLRQLASLDEFSARETVFLSYQDERKRLFSLYPSIKPHSLVHALRHPEHLLGAIQCRDPYQSIFGSRFSYDPKARLGNMSGKIFEEVHHMGTSRIAIDWNVGPTPTVGIDIAPEAKAFIRAIRNGDIAYGAWIYINLQNRKDRHEKKRVRAIESFGEESAGLVSVASISVDSPLYRCAYDTETVSLEETKAYLIRLLSHPGTYDVGSDSWYFFSVPPNERPLWHRNMMGLVEEAHSLASSIASSQASSYHIHKAFQELIVHGLSRGWQGWSLAKAFSEDENGCALSTISCREGVDRGGAINGGMVAFLSETALNSLVQKALAVQWGRPLLFRSRLNEEERSNGFLSLILAGIPVDCIRGFLNSSFERGWQEGKKAQRDKKKE